MSRNVFISIPVSLSRSPVWTIFERCCCCSYSCFCCHSCGNSGVLARQLSRPSLSFMCGEKWADKVKTIVIVCCLLAFLPSCLLAFLPSCLLAFLPSCLCLLPARKQPASGNCQLDGPFVTAIGLWRVARTSKPVPSFQSRKEAPQENLVYPKAPSRERLLVNFLCRRSSSVFCGEPHSRRPPNRNNDNSQTTTTNEEEDSTRRESGAPFHSDATRAEEKTEFGPIGRLSAWKCHRIELDRASK